MDKINKFTYKIAQDTAIRKHLTILTTQLTVYLFIRMFQFAYQRIKQILITKNNWGYSWRINYMHSGCEWERDWLSWDWLFAWGSMILVHNVNWAEIDTNLFIISYYKDDTFYNQCIDSTNEYEFVFQ